MNFKTVLLAAAVVGVAGTAQAADLAKKAPAAANYVKVCDAYGAGFFYIPGSETCLKIGGFVRADYNMYRLNRFNGTFGWAFRGQSGISTQAKAQMQFDARTSTEMGLLRSYIEFEIDSSSFGNGTVGALAAGVTLNKAFVQFGGLTAGRAQSFFDFWTGDIYGLHEAAHSDTYINLLAYTFSFGNGITATVSIEDPSSGNAGRRDGFSPYGGVKTPDLVANVNIEQAWGSAQLMGALHDNYGTTAGKLGYAIGAGVKVNLPMLGAADVLSVQAAYAKGAVSYAAPSVGLADLFGAVIAEDFVIAGGSVHQSSAWSVAAALTHGWTKTLTSSIEASYLGYDNPSPSVTTVDFKQWDVGANLVWTPVSNLAIGAEVQYRKVDFTGPGDIDGVTGKLRIQRNF